MKWVSDLIPFFEPYPVWVKVLISGWVLFTAVCAIALVLGRPAATTAAMPSTAAPTETWLKINGVEIFEAKWKQAGIQVTAEINGISYTYPSVGGARWVVTGPDMSPGLFKMPSSKDFQVTFSMVAKHQGENDETKFVSQLITVVGKDQLPYSGTYQVYRLGSEAFRAGTITAQISFSISNKPN